MSPSKTNIIQELQVNRLPSLPHILVEMLHACENNQASFQDLSQIISRDSAVAARVIFLANSSFYNPGARVNTLERALFLLGTDTLKTLVITAAIQQFFSGFSRANSSFLLPFWQRSLSCALLAKSLALLTSYPNPDEAYLTGLLHNLGELVLESNHPGFYQNLRAERPSASISDEHQLDAEIQQFSFHHAQVGACLANEWGLSQFSCDAIEFHHAKKTQMEDAHHLVKIIYLASYLSHPDKHYLEVNGNLAHHLFELNTALVNEIVRKIDAEVSEISRSLGMENNDQSNIERCQLELANQVRNITLIQSVMSEVNRANSRLELTRALQNTLTWLYDLNTSVIFWYESVSNTLRYEHPDTSNSLPLKFKVEAHRSVLAKAALSKDIACTFGDTETLSVIDAQLLNLLDTENLLIIPLEDQHGLICVIVTAYNKDLKAQTAFHRFLGFFAHEAALACRLSLKQIDIHDNLAAAENKLNSQAVDMAFSATLSAQGENSAQLTDRVQEVLHEANNPLNIINNYLYSLGQRLTKAEAFDSKEISNELNIVREEVLRTSQILLQLRDLKPEENAAPSGVHINEEIQSLCTIYKTSLFLIKHITCQLNLDARLERIHINRNGFKQILTNLLRNAVEALPNHGKISISTNAHVNVNGLDFVELSIADNGPGIPQSILNNLFKPVVSTKGNGHSGLGLSITKNLVKDAKGTISCRSSVNGTVFHVLFPKER